jgi:hypothetical protein
MNIKPFDHPFETATPTGMDALSRSMREQGARELLRLKPTGAVVPSDAVLRKDSLFSAAHQTMVAGASAGVRIGVTTTMPGLNGVWLAAARRCHVRLTRVRREQRVIDALVIECEQIGQGYIAELPVECLEQSETELRDWAHSAGRLAGQEFAHAYLTLSQLVDELAYWMREGRSNAMPMAPTQQSLRRIRY